MAEFTVRYWFGDDSSETGRIPYVSEGITALSEEDAERIVMERMNLPLFAIRSDGYGRAILNPANIRFCSILPSQTPEEAAEQERAAAVVQEYAARAA